MSTSESLSYYLKRYYIKLFHWEYWPMWLVYFPVSFYYIFLSIKSKSFFFFSASNPNIETGGMFFESKWKIYELMPKQYFPTTVFIESSEEISMVLKKMEDASIAYPIIAKPDRGERGWLVQKIHSESELINYRSSVNIDFLIQSFIDYPIELSIFYFRNPKSNTGAITSITLKKFLTIKGDGKNNIETLLKADNRAFLQFKRLKKQANIDFEKVLLGGEELVVVPYGNHALGAKFVNYSQILDQALVNSIDHISKQISGFYFGRFDLKCASIEDLKNGKNISILELNGAGAEPAHIYDPSFSFFQAQLVLAQHYKMMYDASRENNKTGIPFMTLESFLNWKKAEKQYKLNALTV